MVDRDGGGRVPAEGGRAYEGENTFGYVDKYSLDAYSLRIDNKWIKGLHETTYDFFVFFNHRQEFFFFLMLNVDYLLC